MSAIVLIDTSVLLNVLDVSGRNAQRQAVLVELEQWIEMGAHLFIPMAAIIETGNHIAHVADGRERRAAALRFTEAVEAALANQAPWKPINFPSAESVLGWLSRFPEAATRGVGLGDLSIQQEFETCCRRYPMSRVCVWTLDDDLAGLDRPGR
ncbi:hypothetical protein VITFI_CDS2588 [Vitreoscilla filiformis]|uniref:PIN domain-containing protein n=1 Tax=Vitreoscilla filiformis TaxID=63 RepID=A0A221KHC5_VITFI|nr:hypothetical protein [Vitreoscilla filiformis]ASM78365.1 hypothetical protein VITFI_CDS2588 [Vitreoscilla filiformis]